MNQKRRVVVTGLGAITPIGNTLDEYAQGLFDGKSGAAPVTLFDATKFKTQFACEVKGFNTADHFDRKEARKMDPFTQLAMISSEEAMKDCGIDLETVDKTRFGVIWGSGIGGLKTFQDEVSSFANGDGTPKFNPFFIPKMIADIAAGLISIKFGLMGPNYCTVSACASSSHAILSSYMNIKNGYSDIMLTGGSEAAITIAGMGGFNALRAMSTRNDDPSTASRPFDAERDGFVLGEGSGTLILEEYEHAVKRGAKIYAEIGGGGMSADAYHMTAPHPDGIGVSLVMKNCLQDSNLSPKDIDYINVHGTSTPLGDVAELKAITEVFGDHAYDLNISSTKSMIGHLLGAAGAVEAIAAILAIKHQKIPPTINHHTPDPEIDPKFNLTLNKAQERKVNIVLSNTFGFGGHNASIIFKKVD